MKVAKRIIAVAGTCVLANAIGMSIVIVEKGTASDDAVALD